MKNFKNVGFVKCPKNCFSDPEHSEQQCNQDIFLFANQDMVTAIIAESTLDCTVGTKQLLLATPYKAAAPNMGALRMELKRGEKP